MKSLEWLFKRNVLVPTNISFSSIEIVDEIRNNSLAFDVKKEMFLFRSLEGGIFRFSCGISTIIEIDEDFIWAVDYRNLNEREQEENFDALKLAELKNENLEKYDLVSINYSVMLKLFFTRSEAREK